MTSATKGSQRARCLAPTAVNAGEWLTSITGSHDTHLERSPRL
jgi:hypothetical protein